MSEAKPGVPNRIIRDTQVDPEQSLNHREAVVAGERARTAESDGVPRVVAPHFPRRPLPAGDPASESGERVTLDELDPTLRALVLASPPPASETVAGVAELATQVETNTGADDLRIVTPLKQANYIRTENHVIAGRVFN